MKNVALALLMVALVLPAHAGEKKDKKEKEKEKRSEQSSGLSADELLKQAELKAAAGDAAGAKKLLQEVKSMAPAGEVALKLGRLLEAERELDAAIDAYKAGESAASPASKGEALARLALCQEMRALGDATASAEAAAAADPQGAWPAVALARARARQGKADEALALAEKAAAANTGAAGSSAVGLAQEAKGDLKAAEAAYRQALAAEVGRIDATVGLARVLRKTARASEAEPMLKALIDAAPGAVEGYKEAARVKLALGRVDDAMSDSAVASALAENDPETKRLAHQMASEKAVADARRGQADFALADLKRLREQDPKAAELRVGIARVHMVKRDAAAAATELQEALALDPNSADVHFQLGYLSHALKQDAKAALPEYEKAVELAPESLEFRTNLGAVLSELQQFDRAQVELVKVTQSPGGNKVEPWIYLGGAYLNAKKYKDAVAALDKALAIAPDVQMANAYMAWAQFALKDAEAFKKYGAKARALGYKDARFLDNLSKVEGGAPIK
jgi:tetratricopeptide (TPR) repeat protein